VLRAKRAGAPATLLTVGPPTTVRQALSTMTSHGVSQLPVISDGECVGHVAEGSLMARVIESPGVLEKPVHELMEPPLPVVDSHAPLPEVARLLTRENPAVLVRADGRLKEILTRFDLVAQVTSGGL
jgi:cystathionine beta-synthase